MILASASPRRRELLSQIGVSFKVEAADIDETPYLFEAPRDYVERMARQKAAVIAQRYPEHAVLGADTSVI
ncbi:MAG: Maf family protein, partial [Oleibacter sp.]|nr:Maf family protein [Thalassolituus sp.]